MTRREAVLLNCDAYIKTNLSAVNDTAFLLIIASQEVKVNKTEKDIYPTGILCICAVAHATAGILEKNANKAAVNTLIGNIFLLSAPTPCVLTF